ncbi:hypothetical protein A2Y85_04045 [candidate division WOR-3 bacterium RBG_13_43_14]|uniref:Type IX secretion system membrane protein PorP/SprF n=1 Tax=candidate division WOR-3 bacterium RBG_13_43_14 TaxID=1802590 RepID=A0A1F4U9W0_UNCW3|nr:MAG: hypothetical protein A2Y85_04045 [candidate division WOR-3 bacterium RBG_13_43_14]
MFILFILAGTSFFASQFRSLPIRANSVFSNPAGLGLRPGYEAVLNYHPDLITAGLVIRYFSAAMRKADSLYYWETGTGYKLPGAFSIGYAYRFGEINEHILGAMGMISNELSIGYTAKIGDDWHMFGGLAIRPLADYVVLCGDIEYETTYKTTNYYAGIMIQPLSGLKAHFETDQELNWSTGLEISLGKMILGGLYSSTDNKISGGVIFSSDDYPTFLSKEEKIPDYLE